MKMLRVIAFGVLVAAGCADRNEVEWEKSVAAHLALDVALTGPVHDLLSHPDTLELLTLEHHAAVREYDETVTPALFHGHRVLGRATITDEAERYQLVEGFYQSSREGHGELLCFMPHHALHATRGDQTVDILLCFHCLLYQLYDGVEARPETELSRFALSFFMSAAADHGLPTETDELPGGDVTMGDLRRMRAQ